MDRESARIRQQVRSGHYGYPSARLSDSPARVCSSSYFTDLLNKEYVESKASTGNPQFACPAAGTMMLISDLALTTDPEFKPIVEQYAADQAAFFADFTSAWVKLQENGCTDLRDTL